ncbi:hypothetical protein BC827DRAFT_1204586 [Russula dissimulans]|nr:hypothetical protein BC827DRAFT_1204586 [Russula dissimulans]
MSPHSHCPDFFFRPFDYFLYFHHDPFKSATFSASQPSHFASTGSHSTLNLGSANSLDCSPPHDDGPRALNHNTSPAVPTTPVSRVAWHVLGVQRIVTRGAIFPPLTRTRVHDTQDRDKALPCLRLQQVCWGTQEIYQITRLPSIHGHGFIEC